MNQQFDECWADCSRKYWKRRSEAEKEARPFCGVCFIARPAFDAFGIPFQVHHLSYRHAGAELSSELVPVCRQCHIFIEALKDTPRADSFDLVAELSAEQQMLNEWYPAEPRKSSPQELAKTFWNSGKFPLLMEAFNRLSGNQMKEIAALRKNSTVQKYWRGASPFMQ